MARLPVVSGDINAWGDILNNFLGVSLNADGTLKSLINLKTDFGAKGDNTADDTAAFTSAMAAVPVGATVYVPTGTYRVTGVLTLNKRMTLLLDGGAAIVSTASPKIIDITTSGVRILGAHWALGAGSTIQDNSNSSATTTIAINQASTVFDTVIQDVSLRVTTGQAAGDALQVANANRYILERILIDGHNTVGTDNIRIFGTASGGVYFGTLRNLRIGGNNQGIEVVGLNASSPVAFNWFENIVAGLNGGGASITVGDFSSHNLFRAIDIEGNPNNLGNFQLSGANSSQNTLDGIHIEAGAGGRPCYIKDQKAVVIQNSLFNNSVDYGVVIDSAAQDTVIMTSRFTGNTTGSIQTIAGSTRALLFMNTTTDATYLTDGGTTTTDLRHDGTLKLGGNTGVASFGPAGVASITVKNGIVTAIS